MDWKLILRFFAGRQQLPDSIIADFSFSASVRNTPPEEERERHQTGDRKARRNAACRLPASAWRAREVPPEESADLFLRAQRREAEGQHQ